MLRIAFAGTPQFAVPTLQALAASGHQLIGVLTQPDRPAGRGRHLQASPVKTLALELALPVAQPARLDSPEQQGALRDWAPDLLVVVAYGLLLPSAVLSLPRRGCLNLHASLLPRWRGAAPIQHAILAGDTQTGVSITQMDAGLDTGPVLATEAVPIGPRTTTAELQTQLAERGARLLVSTLDGLAAGRLQAIAQPADGATYAPKIHKHSAQIDWSTQAAHIDRQVRAFDPTPVAHTSWEGEPLRIWEAQVLDAAEAQQVLDTQPGTRSAVPGTVLGLRSGALLVLCGAGILAVTRLQRAGRRVVSAQEFAGAQSSMGMRLGI